MADERRPRIEELLDELGAIARHKRSDYTGPNQDPLHNYRASAALAGITAQQSMFGRLCEKVIRVSSIMQNGDIAVKDETINDTLNDIAIIALLMRIDYEQRGGLWPPLPVLSNGTGV